MHDTLLSRVERKKQETRERILKAAEQIFIFEGSYQHTTIREIARRADVGVGSVYLHFKTKGDILGALLAAHATRLKKMMEDIVKPEDSGSEKLDALMRFFDTIRKDTTFFLYGRFSSSGGARVLDEGLLKRIEDEFRGFYTIAVDIFASGKRDGTIRFDGAPELMAAVVLNMSTAFIRDFLFEKDSPNGAILRGFGTEETFEAFTSFIRNALISDSAPRQESSRTS